MASFLVLFQCPAEPSAGHTFIMKKSGKLKYLEECNGGDIGPGPEPQKGPKAMDPEKLRQMSSNLIILMEPPPSKIGYKSRISYSALRTFCECPVSLTRSSNPSGPRSRLLAHLGCLLAVVALGLFVAFVAWFTVVFLRNGGPAGDGARDLQRIKNVAGHRFGGSDLRSILMSGLPPGTPKKPLDSRDTSKKPNLQELPDTAN